MAKLLPEKSGFQNIGIVIVCEDSVSGYQYLYAKAKSCYPIVPAPSPIVITPQPIALKNNKQFIPAQTDAHSLTKNAIQWITDENKKIKDGTLDEPDFYKEVYCVVDVDDNITSGKLAPAYAAIDTANTASPHIKHELIVSNETLEIWYILHFQDILSPLYRGTTLQKNNPSLAITKANQISEVLKKHIDWNKVDEANRPNKQGFKRNFKAFKYLFEYLQAHGDEKKAIERAEALEKISKSNKPFDNPSTDMYKLIKRLNSFKS